MPFQNGFPQTFMAIINMTKCNKNIMKASQGLQYSFKRRFYYYSSKYSTTLHARKSFLMIRSTFLFSLDILKLILHAKPQKSSIALSIINVFWSPLRRTTPENILNMAISLLLQLCSCHLVDIHSNMDNMHTRRKRRHNLHSSHQSCGPTTEVLY